MRRISTDERHRFTIQFHLPDCVTYSEISNNVGPVKSFFCFFSAFLSLFFFFEHTTAFTPKSGLPGPFFDRCFDDLGSLIIFRSTSVRPKHLFDPYFEP